MSVLKIQFWVVPGLRRQDMPKTDNIASANVKAICDTVCTYLQIPFPLLVTKSRKRELVRARYILMRMLRRYTALSLAEIGNRIKDQTDPEKGKDHTTVIHGLQAIQNEMDTDPVIRHLVMELEFSIEQTVPTSPTNRQI